jgi:hypothetical protein
VLAPRSSRLAESSGEAQISEVVVTSIFSDEKISLPRLAVFAFRFAQTKTSLRLPQAKNLPQGRFS